MAHRFTFGSTSNPSKTASATLPEADEYATSDTRANCDPNKLLLCPFDKNHRIRSSRFPYHIIKCRKNHPKLASELQSCPFNARHLVPKPELQAHIETCSDRTLVDGGEEADDHAPPFMLGTKNN
uniref:CHHC U11-48K-type domain-containing protein n=1 Tax=Tetraodon nigroviridis TaxID=99883 RepID=H3C4J0_TETNG